jgi:hypothetical protein
VVLLAAAVYFLIERHLAKVKGDLMEMCEVSGSIG